MKEYKLIAICVRFLCILAVATMMTGCQTSSLKENRVTTATTHFSEQDIKDIIEIVVDELPAATNRGLKKTPKLELVSAEELAAILLEDIEKPNAGKLNNLLRYSKAVSAVYKYKSNSIYVVPDNIHVVDEKIDSVEVNTYYKLLVTISHELVHALQNQEIDFSQLKVKNTTVELKKVSQLIIEGHAQLQTALLLKNMGLIGDIDEYGGADKRKLSVTNLTDQDQLNYVTELSKIYIQGKQFFDYHYKRGGNELAWYILKNPPTTISVVLAPKTYNQ